MQILVFAAASAAALALDQSAAKQPLAEKTGWTRRLTDTQAK
jgi:hypothetical protein